jgi:hypothetical protein
VKAVEGAWLQCALYQPTQRALVEMAAP